MKILLFILLFFLVFFYGVFLFIRFVFPFLIKRFVQRQTGGFQAERREGDIRVDHIPDDYQKKDSGFGDYVDYEEIKDKDE